MTDVGLEARIRVLEAREAIKEARARYARHAALGEFSKVADLFTVDGVFTPPGFPSVRGREQIRAFLARSGPGQVVPLIHNETIEIQGDTAVGGCAMESRYAPNSPTGFVGYYEDSLRLEDGEWLFTERIFTFYERAAD